MILKYVTNYKIEIERHAARAWGVRLWVEQQSFSVGPEDWETRTEAKWFAEQFEKAIDKLLGVVKFRGLGPKVKVKRR